MNEDTIKEQLSEEMIEMLDSQLNQADNDWWELQDAIIDWSKSFQELGVKAIEVGNEANTRLQKRYPDGYDDIDEHHVQDWNDRFPLLEIKNSFPSTIDVTPIHFQSSQTDLTWEEMTTGGVLAIVDFYTQQVSEGNNTHGIFKGLLDYDNASDYFYETIDPIGKEAVAPEYAEDLAKTLKNHDQLFDELLNGSYAPIKADLEEFSNYVEDDTRE